MNKYLQLQHFQLLNNSTTTEVYFIEGMFSLHPYFFFTYWITFVMLRILSYVSVHPHALDNLCSLKALATSVDKIENQFPSLKTLTLDSLAEVDVG